LINPKVVGESEVECAIAEGEGCLSINESKFKTQGYINRKFKIIITGYSYFKKSNVKISKVGYDAIVLQHELDHLQGRLFIDRINKKDP
jgi:peptide deformylase